MECKYEENLSKCPCTWQGCPRKGKCCECIDHHWSKKELPACFFSEKAEKTYNRYVDNFIKDQKNKINK